MANADNPHSFDVFEVEGFGGVVPLRSGKMAASTTLSKGDAIYRNSSGLIALAVSTTGASVLGTAAETVTTGAGENTEILFVPALKEITFSGQCSGTLTQALLGTDVDISGTTGVMEISESASVGGVARLLKLNPKSALGLNAEVLFKWATPQT